MPTKQIKEDKLVRVFDPFAPALIKYKDIFDMKEFYTALKLWLIEYSWTDDVDGSPANEWFEHFYDERVDQKGAKEIWIRWRLSKPSPGSPKLKYYMDINFHVLALASTEVIKEGQKIKANKGEVELKMSGSIEKLYEYEFEKSKFLGPFKKLFSQRVYDHMLEEEKKKLYQEIYIFQNFIKQWFKLKRFLPYEEIKSFSPSYAWPSHQKD
ncbi:MAG: hypothetical protein ABIG93_00880 [archaeon]